MDIAKSNDYKVTDLINDGLNNVTIGERFDFQSDFRRSNVSQVTTSPASLLSGTYQLSSNSDLYSANYNSPAFTIKDENGADIKDYVLVAQHSNGCISEIKFEGGETSLQDGKTSRNSVIYYTDGSQTRFDDFPYIAVKSEDAGLRQAA